MAVVAVPFILYLVRFCSPKPCKKSTSQPAGYFTVTRASPVRDRLGAGGVLSPTGALVPIRKLFAICNGL